LTEVLRVESNFALITLTPALSHRMCEGGVFKRQDNNYVYL